MNSNFLKTVVPFLYILGFSLIILIFCLNVLSSILICLGGHWKQQRKEHQIRNQHDEVISNLFTLSSY
jgi:hypothetical protein